MQEKGHETYQATDGDIANRKTQSCASIQPCKAGYIRTIYGSKSIKHLYQRDQQLLDAELKMLGMDLDIQGSPRVIDFIDKFKSHLVYSQYYYPLLEIGRASCRERV